MGGRREGGLLDALDKGQRRLRLQPHGAGRHGGLLEHVAGRNRRRAGQDRRQLGGEPGGVVGGSR